MVLLAIANANYEFLYVSFGTKGRISDGGVIENTDLSQIVGWGAEVRRTESEKRIALRFCFRRGVCLEKGLFKAFQRQSSGQPTKNFQLSVVPCQKSHRKCFWHFGIQIYCPEILHQYQARKH